MHLFTFRVFKLILIITDKFGGESGFHSLFSVEEMTDFLTTASNTLQNQVLCMKSNWWPTMEMERVTAQKDWCPLQNKATQHLVSLEKNRILFLERTGK